MRPAVVFGRGEGGNFTRLAGALRKGRFAFPGRSDTVKACIYVSELVRSIFFARELGLPRLVYNMAYQKPYNARDICEAFHEVAGFAMPRRTVPLAPILLVGWTFEVAAMLGLKTSINRARVLKLVKSTHIVPARLQELDYRFETDLREGLRRWRDETGGSFV